MKKAWISALVGSLALSSGVVSQQGMTMASSAPPACLTFDRITKYNVTAPNRLLIQADAPDFFELETTGTCPALDPSMRLVLEARGRDTVVCVGKEASLLVRESSGTRSRCSASLLTQVSPARAAEMLKAK